MSEHDDIHALYDVATDAEVAILDALRLRAHQVWKCACGWLNPADRTTCWECTTTRDPRTKDGDDAGTCTA